MMKDPSLLLKLAIENIIKDNFSRTEFVYA